jgi:hypothetical protein
MFDWRVAETGGWSLANNLRKSPYNFVHYRALPQQDARLEDCSPRAAREVLCELGLDNDRHRGSLRRALFYVSEPLRNAYRRQSQV